MLHGHADIAPCVVIVCPRLQFGNRPGDFICRHAERFVVVRVFVVVGLGRGPNKVHVDDRQVSIVELLGPCVTLAGVRMDGWGDHDLLASAEKLDLGAPMLLALVVNHLLVGVPELR